MWVSGDVVGSSFTIPFLRRSRFLPEGSPGTFKPLPAHPSPIIGGSFAFLLATPFPSKDKFWKTHEVGPSSGVVA